MTENERDEGHDVCYAVSFAPLSVCARGIVSAKLAKKGIGASLVIPLGQNRLTHNLSMF